MVVSGLFTFSDTYFDGPRKELFDLLIMVLRCPTFESLIYSFYTGILKLCLEPPMLSRLAWEVNFSPGTAKEDTCWLVLFLKVEETGVGIFCLLVMALRGVIAPIAFSSSHYILNFDLRKECFLLENIVLGLGLVDCYYY